MSPGLFQGFTIFVPGVTLANEDTDKSKISRFCFFGVNQMKSPRFPCVTPVVESFLSDLLRAI